MIDHILDDHNDVFLRQVSLENEPLADDERAFFDRGISPNIDVDGRTKLNMWEHDGHQKVDIKNLRIRSTSNQ